MKNWMVAVLCGMLSSAIALPAANSDSRDEKAVMATLEDMAQATIKRDVATLDKIYHPDLTYSHSSAMLQSKAEVLKAAAGPAVTESMTFHDSTIRVYGNVALVRGGNELRNGTPGAMHDNHLNILWVLLKGPGPHGWQIVARQTTRLPEK
ncbi:MAG TPA: nuclear transport factor 2 family protein [Bryobacteraceae bacterium]|jgi:ketosteroid isomerase-like protein|nr:nuclear transport factor 2 family protein [Bryobacteraceae bacterium]